MVWSVRPSSGFPWLWVFVGFIWSCSIAAATWIFSSVCTTSSGFPDIVSSAGPCKTCAISVCCVSPITSWGLPSFCISSGINWAILSSIFSCSSWSSAIWTKGSSGAPSFKVSDGPSWAMTVSWIGKLSGVISSGPASAIISSGPRIVCGNSSTSLTVCKFWISSDRGSPEISDVSGGKIGILFSSLIWVVVSCIPCEGAPDTVWLSSGGTSSISTLTSGRSELVPSCGLPLVGKPSKSSALMVITSDSCISSWITVWVSSVGAPGSSEMFSSGDKDCSSEEVGKLFNSSWFNAWAISIFLSIEFLEDIFFGEDKLFCPSFSITTIIINDYNIGTYRIIRFVKECN